MGPLDAAPLAAEPVAPPAAPRASIMPTAAGAAELNAAHGGLDARALIELAVGKLFPGRIAMVSSFGAESAVLLHLLASVDRGVPVIFIDTGRLFAETLAYRAELTDHLGLTDVRVVGPDAARLAEADPAKALWMVDPDRCCAVRKTEPLNAALEGFAAWFTGRKRFQTDLRSGLRTFEADRGRIKVNPLASWSGEDIAAYRERFQLPAHPLLAKGYPSIGCVPCTDRVLPGEDQRAGRWRGLGKTECGIHIPLEADGSGI
ncbi:MAG: phosphoadenylyl-sulfate reductase [Bauldia sp.]